MNATISGAVVGGVTGAAATHADPYATALSALVGIVAQLALTWISSRFERK